MNCLEDILNKVDAIQPLPGTVLRLINVINEPSSTVADIVEIIKYDQAVTSQMLRLCNSPYFGLSREVNSLSDAMRFLGTVKVLQLVMAVHCNSLLHRKQEGYGLAAGALWKHSVAVALASSILAQRTGQCNANLIFTAGLLHDVGKVILSEHVAEEFEKIIQLVNDEGVSFIEAEKNVLGFSHAEIGGKIAEKWQLPDPIVRCIQYHHEPSELTSPDLLVDTVYLADCLCLLLGIGLGTDGLCYRADDEVMQRCGLGGSDLEIIGSQLMTDLKRVEQVFAEDSGQTEREPLPARKG